MPNLVTVTDLQARWRPLTTAEQDVAGVLLDDAWAVLLTAVPDLQARLDSGALSPALVKSVVAGMVLRVLRNPDGLLTETVDDYTYRRDSATSTGALYVADTELGLLAPAMARSSSVRLVVAGDA